MYYCSIFKQNIDSIIDDMQIMIFFCLVSVRPVTLMQGLSDLTVCEGDIAQLEVRFSQENVEGSWMKNGQPIFSSDRIHIIIDKHVHKLLVENVNRDDAGIYSFVVPIQDISTTGKLTVQSMFFFLSRCIDFES